MQKQKTKIRVIRVQIKSEGNNVPHYVPHYMSHQGAKGVDNNGNDKDTCEYTG